MDFGASDAALSNDRLKEMPRKVLHFPTVGGAVVLAYNLPGFDGSLQLTPDVIVGIYMGRITTWNDKRVAAANPGKTMPAAPILAVHRSDGSGTTNIFVSYLAAVSAQWKELVGVNTSVSWPSGVGGKGNDGVAGVVKQTPGAIGYVELAYAKQNQLPYALVQNKAGKFIEPTLESDRRHGHGRGAVAGEGRAHADRERAGPDAYPIAGLTFLLDLPGPEGSRHGEGALRLHHVGDARWPGTRGLARVRSAS